LNIGTYFYHFFIYRNILADSKPLNVYIEWDLTIYPQDQPTVRWAGLQRIYQPDW